MRLVDWLSRYNVNTEGRCWLWTMSKDPNGYGLVKIKGRYHRAHRVAYEISMGTIPDGLVIDHMCRVPSCVNPHHMEPVTIGENIRRGDNHNRRKTHCKRGHVFTDENTLILKTGSRACRDCARIRISNWRARNAIAS